jgi:hypothetical protein
MIDMAKNSDLNGVFRALVHPGEERAHHQREGGCQEGELQRIAHENQRFRAFERGYVVLHGENRRLLHRAGRVKALPQQETERNERQPGRRQGSLRQ